MFILPFHVCLRNILSTVFVTALRNVPILQQYKTGLMDEFMKTAVVAKPQALFQLSVTRYNVIAMDIGI